MIEISHLTKKYGTNVAVNDLNLTLEPGNIYGFLGPNGAGKSTTMNIITGYIGATSGEVKINGYDINKNPEEAKKCIGYLPEIPPVYGDMKVLEYLKFVAELKKLDPHTRNADIKQVIDLTKLYEMKDRLIRNLSKGYRQRVGLAQALMGMPEIIILDEPTVGLDPKQIIEIRDLIRSLKGNHTVILSSHILQEISAVCDHVFIISKGNLVASDSMEHLESRMSGAQQLDVVVQGTSEQIAGLKQVDGIRECNIIRKVLLHDPDTDIETNDSVPEEKTTEDVSTLEVAQQEAVEEMQAAEATGMESEQQETVSVKTESDVQKSDEMEISEEKELHLSVIAQEGKDIRASVFRYCALNDLVLLEMKTNMKTLEDVFLELTGSEEVHKA